MGTTPFAGRIVDWQLRHGRHDLPWQGTEPYRVWLSEIMLQQTQVATVIPYYLRFIETFPDVATLAAASEDNVLAHWSGLGYYARGRNLHRTARIIMEQHGGNFPRQFERILELPGVGKSTAAAICALAWNEPRAILDGNVKRVLARYCGIDGWPGDKPVEARLWHQAETLLPLEDAAAYTQGLMDLGASICLRSKPKCAICPASDDCHAFNFGRVTSLPGSRPKKAAPQKHACLLLLIHGKHILLEKRPPAGIWGGLWSLPQFNDRDAALSWCSMQGIAAACSEEMPHLAHTFTHFRLHISPLRVKVQRKLHNVMEPGMTWHKVEEARRAAIPAPVRTLLESI